MSLTKEEILNLINSKSWFHSFEIVDKITTPGICPVKPEIWTKKHFPENITGKRFLEIGTWDGPYAFSLEKRGAIVEATDIQDPDRTGFNVAKKILNSRVNYTQTSVYDVDAHFDVESFDEILFLGVYYHLKYPVLAFEKLANLLKKDGRLHFEGECLLNYAINVNGKVGNLLNRVIIREIAHSEYPVTLYYSGEYKQDPSNWHIPNFACLREWMKTAGLEVQKHSFHTAKKGGIFNKFPSQRVRGFAVKTGDRKIEHSLV